MKYLGNCTSSRLCNKLCNQKSEELTRVVQLGITRIGSRAKHLEFAIYSTIGSSHKIELYFNEPHPKKANSHLTLFGSFQLHWNYLNTISVGRIKLTLKRRKPRKRKPDFGLDQLGTERGFVRVAVTATLWKGRLLRWKLRIVWWEF